MKTLGVVGVAGIAGCGGGGDGTPTETDATDGTPTDTEPPGETPTDTDPPDETPTDTEPPGETPTDTPSQPFEDPRQILELDGASTGPGGTTTLSGSASNPYLFPIRNVVFTLSGPDAWTISTPEKQFDSIDTGSSVDVSWDVTAPDSASGSAEFTVTTSYESTTDSAELTQTVDVLVFEPGAVPEDGLEAYYPLDGSAATNAVTGTDATIAGEPTTDAEGVVDGAFEFTSTGDRESVSDALVTEELPLNGEGATVGAWVNVTGHENFSKIYQVGGSLDAFPTDGWDLEFDDDTNAVWSVSWQADQGDAVRAEATKTSLSLDTWYFLVVVVDGDDVRVHAFDQSGELDASPNTGNFSPRGRTDTAPLNLMAGVGDDTAGRLDEVRAYSRALSEEEVTSLYQGSSVSSE
jgi:hypothetical protein